MHIMCYDYYGSWDKKVGYNSPLNSENDLNVDFSINYFLKLGAPAEKLIMGVPFYGRTFVGSNHEGNIGDSASDIGFKGPFTRENGFMGYNEVRLGFSHIRLQKYIISISHFSFAVSYQIRLLDGQQPGTQSPLKPSPNLRILRLEKFKLLLTIVLAPLRTKFATQSARSLEE